MTKDNLTTGKTVLKEKREQLFVISEQARELREREAIALDLDTSGVPLNYYIADVYGIKYDSLKTFSEWKKAGYTIKKGTKAFLFWGQPKKYAKNPAVENLDVEMTEDEKTIKYFPICYLFSKSQVFKKQLEKQSENI